MGIVIRQGLKSTVVQYVGVVVGVVANLFLYTRLEAAYGLIQVLIVAANTIVPVAMLGSYALAVRFYPRVKEAGSQGFLTLLMLLTLLGTSLFVLLWPWLEGPILTHFFSDTNPTYSQYISLVPVLVVLFAFSKLLIQYTSNFQRIVVPTLIDQFAFKLVLPLLLALFLFGTLPLAGVVYGTLAHYTLVLLGLLVYLASLGQLRLPRIRSSVLVMRREMANFASFGIAGMLGGMLAFRIDVLMVAAYLDFAAAGQYAIALFMSEVIAKPYTNLRAVVGPLVSAAWAREDYAELQNLYRRSCDNMLLISGYVYGGILVCFPGLVDVASNGEVLAGAFGAFALLGATRVIDASTSVNEHLITYSPRYQFNLIAIAILAVINVLLNVWLLPLYGILGAGLATLISISIYNLAKVIFAGLSFGLWPFGKTTYAIAGVLLVLIAGVYFLPLTNVWWFDILSRGGLLTLLVGAYVWWGKPSVEATQVIQTGLTKLGIATA